MIREYSKDVLTEYFRLLGKRKWTVDAHTEEEYPVEGADWEAMGTMDSSWWLKESIPRCSNSKLVENGVFDGKFS